MMKWNNPLDRMTKSAIRRMFRVGRRWRAPRHPSARSLSEMKSLLVIVLLALCGCSHMQDLQPHSHLWTGDSGQSVWTYQQVRDWSTRMSGGAAQTGYVSHELGTADRVVLSNGTVITYDGKRLTVGDQMIPAEIRNVVVDGDGTIRTNAFIKTFD